MKPSVLFCSAVLFVTTLATLPLASAQGYRLTDLGRLTGGTSVATGINDLGQVVGYTYAAGAPGSAATLWSGGVATNLGTLGGDNSRAYGINNAGQIVGTANTAGSQDNNAVLWSGNGITALAGGSGGTARAINSAGQIAGDSMYGDFRHATVWNGAARTDLGTLGGYGSVALAINERGQVAGMSDLVKDGDKYNQVGVLWSGGATSPPLYNFSHADGMNDAAVLVGAARGPFTQASRWGDGQAVTLSQPDTYGVAYDINNAMQAVGFAVSDLGGPYATLWNGTSQVDLNSVFGANNAGFASLMYANAINEHGQIVGYGVTFDGQQHAFLLSPVPEPATVAMFLAGVGLIGTARRRHGVAGAA